MNIASCYRCWQGRIRLINHPPMQTTGHKMRACAGSMEPPVAAAVDDLGYCRGYQAPHLDDIWTLQGCHGSTFGHADHVPGRESYSRLFASHRQVAETTNAPSDMSMDCEHIQIPADAPEQSGLCRPVPCPAQRRAVVVGRPGRASGLAPGGAVPLPGRIAGVYDPRAAGSGGTARRGVRVVQACRDRTQPEENGPRSWDRPL